MHLVWEALSSPVHKVRSEGQEPLNNLLRDPQLVSGGVSIWTQVDMPPPSSLNDQESLGEEKGVEEKGFVERLHISARPRGKGFRKGPGLRSLVPDLEPTPPPSRVLSGGWILSHTAHNGPRCPCVFLEYCT